jgi:hypothetical protein
MIGEIAPALIPRRYDPAMISAKTIEHFAAELESHLLAARGGAPVRGIAGEPPALAQFVSVPHCEAMRSAPRCDSAKMVKVGFEAPSVGKIPGPATQRFGISWHWP